jgi:uncharacterized membrane protein
MFIRIICAILGITSITVTLLVLQRQNGDPNLGGIILGLFFCLVAVLGPKRAMKFAYAIEEKSKEEELTPEGVAKKEAAEKRSNFEFRIFCALMGLALTAGAIATLFSDELMKSRGLIPFFGLLAVSLPFTGWAIFCERISGYFKKQELAREAAKKSDDPMIKVVDED